jgi:hypothetical protein
MRLLDERDATDRQEEQMSRIFVNYRRADAAAHANLLYEWTSDRYGESSVFKDVDTIDPGRDFERAIERAIGSSRVMLVVIGRDWLAGGDGRRRLDEPDDYVRLEIESALRADIRVIPVLVAGARMPAAAELPESLRPLTRRHAFELGDDRARIDRAMLLGLLDEALGVAPDTGVRAVGERLYDRLSVLSKALFVLELRVVSWPFRKLWRLGRAAVAAVQERYRARAASSL